MANELDCIIEFRKPETTAVVVDTIEPSHEAREPGGT